MKPNLAPELSVDVMCALKIAGNIHGHVSKPETEMQLKDTLVPCKSAYGRLRESLSVSSSINPCIKFRFAGFS